MSLLDSACRIGHRKYLLNELISDYRIHTTPAKTLYNMKLERVRCVATNRGGSILDRPLISIIRNIIVYTKASVGFSRKHGEGSDTVRTVG